MFSTTFAARAACSSIFAVPSPCAFLFFKEALQLWGLQPADGLLFMRRGSGMATPQLRYDFFSRRNYLWCFISPLTEENMEKVKRLK